jgi:sodium/proline symporter
LIKLSHRVTLVLALIAFGVGMGLLGYNKEQALFWVVIFGWSGIAATFCPMIILSLFWSKFTALGAKGAMISGFLMVPLLKFAAGPVFDAIGWTDGAAYLAALDVLLPAFIISGVVGIALSLVDKAGQEDVRDAKADLDKAAGKGE